MVYVQRPPEKRGDVDVAVFVVDGAPVILFLLYYVPTQFGFLQSSRLLCRGTLRAMLDLLLVARIRLSGHISIHDLSVPDTSISTPVFNSVYYTFESDDIPAHSTTKSYPRSLAAQSLSAYHNTENFGRGSHSADRIGARRVTCDASPILPNYIFVSGDSTFDYDITCNYVHHLCHINVTSPCEFTNN